MVREEEGREGPLPSGGEETTEVTRHGIGGGTMKEAAAAIQETEVKGVAKVENTVSQGGQVDRQDSELCWFYRSRTRSRSPPRERRRDDDDLRGGYDARGNEGGGSDPWASRKRSREGDE